MVSTKRLLLTLPDYERIFQIVHSLLQNEKANVAKACLYFGFIGSAILRSYYKTSARAVVGMALYKLDESNDFLGLAERLPDGRFTASLDGFHCWVEAKGWVIDFSAPLFPEMYLQAGYAKYLPRKMLQKRREVLAASPRELKRAGDALLIEEPTLTHYFHEKQMQHAMNKDLEDIALQWFEPTPKKINAQIGIRNQNGEAVLLALSRATVTGAW